MEKSLHANKKGRRARAGGEKQYIHLLVTHPYLKDIQWFWSNIVENLSLSNWCTRHNFNKT